MLGCFSCSHSARLCRNTLFALLMLAPLAAQAQSLDSPTLRVQRTGFFRVDLEVRAGTSGAPNGFTLQWMPRGQFDAFGWPADEGDIRASRSVFTGEPTLNLDARSTTFRLNADDAIGVQVGDLFDETGLTTTYADHLQPGDYVFRTWANGNGDGTVAPSAPSTLAFAATANPECTQGFWKTHPEVWPIGCTPMTLGTVSYTKTQLLAIFNQPADGNGLISMAHQLIAVKLNQCNGSNVASIAGAIASANSLIGALVIPPIGAGFLAPSQTSSLTNTLDNYNNGIIPGVVACATPARGSTWGQVKAMYR